MNLSNCKAVSQNNEMHLDQRLGAFIKQVEFDEAKIAEVELIFKRSYRSGSPVEQLPIDCTTKHVQEGFIRCRYNLRMELAGKIPFSNILTFLMIRQIKDSILYSLPKELINIIRKKFSSVQSEWIRNLFFEEFSSKRFSPLAKSQLAKLDTAQKEQEGENYQSAK